MKDHDLTVFPGHQAEVIKDMVDEIVWLRSHIERLESLVESYHPFKLRPAEAIMAENDVCDGLMPHTSRGGYPFCDGLPRFGEEKSCE